MGRKNPDVSVIIPTRMRTDKLERVLCSLESQQELEPEQFEIIVVVDGQDDEQTLSLLDSRMKRKSIYEMRFFNQPHWGPGIARNFGASKARGKILLFLGDDTYAEALLIRTHLSFHTTHSSVACLGSIHNEQSVPRDNLHQFLMHGSQFSFPREDGFVDYWHFYTANISLPRESFFEYGGFNEAFRGAGWEDIEFGYRFCKRYAIWYASQARVFHDHPISLNSFCQRQKRLGKDVHLFLDMHPELDQYFKLRQYPLVRLAKTILSAPILTRVMMNLFPQMNKLAYSPLIHYYFRILRYQMFYTGYTRKESESEHSCGRDK